MNVATRLEFTTLSEQVSNILGQAIVTGEYAANARLPTETQLCEKYGISRTVVREAIKILNAKGLISSNSRYGIMVESTEEWNLYDNNVLFWLQNAGPSESILKQFLQMRLAIEPQAVSLAARYGSADSLARIAMAMEALKDSIESGYNDLIERLGDYHAELLKASGNRFFGQLQGFIRTAIRLNSQPRLNQDQAIAMVEEYSRLTSLLTDRQPDRASYAIVYVIESAIAELEDQATIPLRVCG